MLKLGLFRKLSISSARRLGLVGFVLAAVTWFWLKPLFQTAQKADHQPLTSPNNFSIDSANQLAFQELTIPYLRNRPYSSSLKELKPLAKTQTYASYLTSYDSDGSKVDGLLTKPEGDQPEKGWPAVVFVHGYIPPTSYKTQEKYLEYVHALANSGLVVFKIDLRGHGNSEGTPSGSYYSAGYVIDTLNAIAALETTDFVDKTKIGLWGHSMAGNIVLRSFAAKPQIPAVVIWAGAGFSYADLKKYGLNDNSYRPPQPSNAPVSDRQRLFSIHGQFDPNNEFWRQVTPVNYLQDLKGAIQLHHAINDPVVNSGYSQDLAEALNKTAIPHELFTYQTGGHNITGDNFTKAMQRTVEFYQKYL